MSTDKHFCKTCREPIDHDSYDWYHTLTGRYMATDGKGKEHAAIPGGRAPKKDKQNG